MPIVCDTTIVPPEERQERWIDAVSRRFPLEVLLPRETPLTGRIVEAAVGPLTFGRVQASPQTAYRTRQLDTGDYYSLGLMLQGSISVSQDGRQAVQRRGDFMIVDASRPVTMVANNHFRILACTMRRNVLRVRPERVAQITATAIPGQRGIGWVITPVLHRLARLAERGEVGSELHRVVEGTLDLVASLCEHQLGEDVRHALPRAELLLRIRAYVDANLGNPELSPEQIARAHFISKRSLHRLFEAEGTSVARLIRDRRVEHCRQQLCDPACAHESVTWIGARWGLSDPRHFSRLFRLAHGCSPSDYRRERLTNLS